MNSPALMARTSATALLVASGLVLTACGGDRPATPAAPTAAAVVGIPAPEPPARVLLISVDGLRADSIPNLRPPAMLALAARGSSTWRASTTMPPETLPAHGSMISGVDPVVHGITWGDYSAGRGLIRVPTMFTAAQAAGRSTGLVAGKNGFRHYLLPGSVGHFADLNGGAEAVAANALGVLGATDLLMVHFADVDLSGHRTGWLGSSYCESLRRVDAAVGQLVAAAGPDVTVILTADHGGIGMDHLGGFDENMQIPWVIAGPRIARGRDLGFVQVKDTAPTILHLMGVAAPPGMTGRAITEALVR